MNNKYKYRLVINENQSEEDGLKNFQTQNELVLQLLGDYNSDTIIDIINDPKNLEKIFAKESSGLKELETKVFGDRPGIASTVKNNINIYNENGKKLYNDIENISGEKFDKKGVEVYKNKEGQILYIFPKKTLYNKEILEKYYNKISGENAKKSTLKPKRIDDFTLKFQLIDGPVLKKILNNAGLESGKDYKLLKQEVTD